MKVVAIIQARMGSTRLPGKVLMDLEGQTVLARVVHRVLHASLVNETIVATTTSSTDDPIVRECERLGVVSFRGSEEDVLDRYYQAALGSNAEAVVRVTSDCPMIEPELIDAVIQTFVDRGGDYASNALDRTFPRGLDAEVFSFPALQQAWANGDKLHEREHVTPYLYEHPELFKLISVRAEQDNSQYRWTLDTPEDLELLRAIHKRFAGIENFHWREALSLMQTEPDLAGINSHIPQKPVH